MHSIKATLVAASLSFTFIGCSQTTDPMFLANDSLAPYEQESFDAYLEETKLWLLENRHFVSNDKQKELDAVMPFELVPDNPNGAGILLVHGLSDSPYSFVDMAPILAEQGYLVRVILLPGHGSKPADLQLVELEDWNSIVEHHTKLLQSEVERVWLGGFSTGTNLVTHYAATHSDDIEGLILVSTAYHPRDPMAKYTPYAKWFTDWVDQDVEDNHTRYTSFSMHGAATYYQSTKQVKQHIEDKQIDLPTFMILSEADETIDSQYAVDSFTLTFNHPESRALWFGETAYADPRVTQYSMDLPHQNIISASHISPLFDIDNPTYKRDGEIRFCFDEQPEIATVCETSDNVWFGAYGLGDESTHRARLSWNPYFDETMESLIAFLEKN
jgi:esterase/lipase